MQNCKGLQNEEDSVSETKTVVRDTPRHNELRVRVRDWIRHRATLFPADGIDGAQREFARKAVSMAKSRNARVWSENTISAVTGALQSVRYLLCEQKCWNAKKGHYNTGGGEGWVLDVFEAVLAKETGQEVTLQERLPVLEQEREVGVEAFAEKKEDPKKTDRPASGLGLQLLTAYFQRDSEEIMRIAEMLG